MNERIQELKDQCWVEKRWTVRQDNGMWIEKHIDQEKFAELIVRECSELIDNKVTITAAQTYDEVFVARYDTKELCAKQIKEHFGVEE